MNMKSLYCISLALESLLQDIMYEDTKDEEVLENLVYAKRITDVLSEELNNYINNKKNGG